MKNWTFTFEPQEFLLRLAGSGCVLYAVRNEDYIMALVGIILLSLWVKTE